jgi:cytochrome c5
MKSQMSKVIKSAPAISLSILLLAAIQAAPQATGNNSGSNKTTQKPAKVKTIHAAEPRDGQQIFAQNCERCHNAPQGFSPSISGTVVRHMRVRANLSEQDAQALMRFFNP